MTAPGALDGIRVLELGTLIAGPFAGRLLGDMGADVIKIEPPGAPDPLRTWGQAELDGHHFFWTVHARNKKAVTLDLRQPRGREVFLDLVEKSDIVVENFRPGTLEKWNLGYDILRARNRGIILVRVSGYGQSGPDARKAGYASVAEAASGLRHLNGFPGGPPPRLALSLGDSLAGMFAAQGALAALYRRGITGHGQVVDVALTESCLAIQESTIPDYDVGGVVRGPSGTRLDGIAPSNIYRSADGTWVVIAANQDTVFARLCQAMGRGDLVGDDRFATHVARGRNQDELDAIIGEPLDPVLAGTAAAQRDGQIGAGHVAVIRGFYHRLPDFVDVDTRGHAEAQLARQGGEFRPDQLAKLADKLTDCLNPDGNFTDADRARRRGLILGKQDIDGMSSIRGYLTPEARAGLDPVLAKLAAPGMCNPDDPTPCVSGTPSQDAIQGDTRSAGQRNHDALGALLRNALSSGELGRHNGLPASIIVSTTLAELEAGAGKALTGGGTLLPMSDVTRLAQHAHHYLAIFDQGNAIGLYHTKRLASPGQRIVLHAKDRGCTHPGCDVPGYLTEVHHVTDFAQCRDTHINKLTQACGPHHKLVTCGGWTTRKNAHGDTEWIPPEHLDRGQNRINRFHHPEKLLRDDDDDDGP